MILWPPLYSFGGEGGPRPCGPPLATPLKVKYLDKKIFTEAIIEKTLLRQLMAHHRSFFPRKLVITKNRYTHVDIF